MVTDSTFSENKYPRKLMDHLKDIDSADEIKKSDWSDIDIASRWRLYETEDTGEASSKCPCGKKGIRYLLHIHNMYDQNIKTFVGSKCIKIFEEQVQHVLEVALRVMEIGLKCKYKGITRTKNPKLRFQISARCGLVKRKENFQLFLNYVPVYQAGKLWEIAVFPPRSKRVNSVTYAMQNEFEEGETYHVKLAMREWKLTNGTSGFSLSVISYDNMNDYQSKSVVVKGRNKRKVDNEPYSSESLAQYFEEPFFI